MAEYLIQEETLIEIADEVRTLSGETKNLTTTEIKSNINTANNTINTQTDLIEQIQTALEGKAGGGGDTPTYENVTVDFSFTATNSSYAPTVVYAYYSDETLYSNRWTGSGTSGSTNISVAKGTLIHIYPRYTTDGGIGVNSYTTSDWIEAVTYNGLTSSRFKTPIFLINNSGTLSVTMDVVNVGGGSND